MLNRPLCFDDIPLVLTVEELMPILSIGRNTAFALVRSGQIKSIRAGKDYLPLFQLAFHPLHDFQADQFAVLRLQEVIEPPTEFLVIE